jgi:hypothetical protein
MGPEPLALSPFSWLRFGRLNSMYTILDLWPYDGAILFQEGS